MTKISLETPEIAKIDKESLSHILEKYLKDNYKLCLIKSNVCGYYPPSLKTLQWLLEKIYPRCNQILLGDTSSTIHDANKRLKELGLIEIAQKIGEKVKAVDFSKIYKNVSVNVPKPPALKKYPIPQIVYESDFLINIEKNRYTSNYNYYRGMQKSIWTRLK